jgi:hypothetical protein
VHVKQIYRRLGVSSRGQLLSKCFNMQQRIPVRRTISDNR